jgi:hypothetical protein
MRNCIYIGSTWTVAKFLYSDAISRVPKYPDCRSLPISDSVPEKGLFALSASDSDPKKGLFVSAWALHCILACAQCRWWPKIEYIECKIYSYEYLHTVHCSLRCLLAAFDNFELKGGPHQGFCATGTHKNTRIALTEAPMKLCLNKYVFVMFWA